MVVSTFVKFDVQNSTGRVYDSEWLKKEVERYNKENQQILGCLDKREPNEPLLLGEISHKVRDIHFNNEDVSCDIEFLNTPMGNVAQRMIDDIKNYHIEASFMPSGELRSFDFVKNKPIF